MPARARVAAAHVLALVLGLLAGALGSFLQAASLDLGPLTLPYGIVAAFVLSGVAFLAAEQGTGGRSGRVAAVLGWLLGVVPLAIPRPEGDLVVTAGTRGLVWLFGGTVLAGLSLAAPARLPGRRAAPGTGP